MTTYIEANVKTEIIEICLTCESIATILEMLPIANTGGDKLTTDDMWRVHLAHGDAAGHLSNTEHGGK
jgi:hypothetical protein